jgi:hypothetical protein
MYDSQSSFTGFSFINDNQTVVGKNHSGWQYEFSYVDDDGVNSKGHSVFAMNNGNYYSFSVVYPDELEVKRLPEFKKLIDSIDFLPVQVPKKPSFMNANDTQELKSDTSLETNPTELEILSHNSFTDSAGYLHVVGEVKNNSASTARFVKIIGTFYDINNQVVATDFAYTNPTDIGSGATAPFEILLLSASVPISQINNPN